MSESKKVKRAKDLILGRLKKSTSYHTELENETIESLRELSKKEHTKVRARQMLKLVMRRNKLIKELKEEGRYYK